MLTFFPGRARWRARLVATACACAWPLAVPAAAELPSLEPLDWRQANEAVGRFLRGHIDLIKTEPDTPPPMPELGALLDLDEALSLAWARRPDLFERPGMAPSERLAQRREALALRLRVQSLWSHAVLAARQARLSEEVAAAAHTGAELGRRMAEVGNWSAARWQREQALALDAQMAHAQVRQQALSTREALVRALALGGEAARLRLPHSLPPAPALPQDAKAPDDKAPDQALATWQALAARHHPTVAQARVEAQRLARGVNPAHLALAHEQLLQAARLATAAGAPNAPINPATLGWSPELEAALAAGYQAQAQEAALQSQVREAWQQLQTSQQHSAQLGQLLTLHTELLADMQRRYNGMLNSTWDLLASARERLAVEQRLLQAQHQQWLAQAALQHLLAGGEPDSTTTPSGTPAAAVRTSPDH